MFVSYSFQALPDPDRGTVRTRERPGCHLDRIETTQKSTHPLTMGDLFGSQGIRSIGQGIRGNGEGIPSIGK